MNSSDGYPRFCRGGDYVLKPDWHHCFDLALPIFINNYGISNTMLMGAGISLFGLLISVAFAPETRGMSLAQTSNMTIRRQRAG